MQDTINYIEELRGVDVNIIFLNQGINTADTTKYSKAMLGLFAGQAEEEVRMLSARVKWGLKISAENGVPKIHNILGYTNENKKLVIIEEEAKIVRLIFKLYLDGLGTRKIARELEKRRYRTKKGNVRWYSSTVKNVIINQTYIGTLVKGKRVVKDVITLEWEKIDKSEWIVVPNACEPIIDEETFNRAQAILKSSSAYDKEGNLKGVKHSTCAWNKKVYCGVCGGAMTRHAKKPNKNNTPNALFLCSNYNQFGTLTSREADNLDGGCNNNKWVIEWKLNLVASYIVKKIIEDNGEHILEAYKMYLDAVMNADTNLEEVERLKKEKNTLLGKQEVLLEKLLNESDISERMKEMYNRKSKDIDTQIDDIEKRLHDLQDIKTKQTKAVDDIEGFKKLIKELSALDSLKLNDVFISKFVKRLEIFPNNKFSVYLYGVSEAIELDGRFNKTSRQSGVFVPDNI